MPAMGLAARTPDRLGRLLGLGAPGAKRLGPQPEAPFPLKRRLFASRATQWHSSLSLFLTSAEYFLASDHANGKRRALPIACAPP